MADKPKERSGPAAGVCPAGQAAQSCLQRLLVVVGADETGSTLTIHGDRLRLPHRVADFLKREAKRDIEALVLRHTGAIGRKAKSIRFKDTSSRWGSCTADGNLSFSWRIMMAPAR